MKGCSRTICSHFERKNGHCEQLGCSNNVTRCERHAKK